MNSTFFEKSKEIADNFIQNILFVDDQIYTPGDRNHDLDISQLLKTFEKAKKLCALSSPQSEEDFDNIIEVAKKADVIVLDWKIILDSTDDTIAEDEDVEEIDVRGAFTIRLIKHLLEEKQNEIKLIVIYTGEVELPSIVRSVLDACNNEDFQQEAENIIGKPNFRIVVAGKPTLRARLNHTPELRDWIIEYSDIHNKILNEFTKMTEGLISNVALQALTSIRNNSFKLLNIYNQSVDPAFLAHRASLPNVDDAGEILKDSIITSIKAILDYDEIEMICSYPLIKKWIGQVNLSDKCLKINKKELTITKKEISQWQREGFLKSFDSIWSQQFPDSNLDSIKLQSYYKENLHKEALRFFTPDELNAEKIEEKFSIMTHHKSSFSSPSYIPKLSLGTIVKGQKTEKYWLCIQQKCDSVRIKEDESRRFLFLPLKLVEEGKKFNFLIIEEDIPVRLLVEYDTHNIRTIRFKSNRNEAVYARRYGKSSKYFFNPFYYKDHQDYNKKYDENFVWVFDLKDEHAQRIANIYSSKLSRVGLDESEWLRRWSGN